MPYYVSFVSLRQALDRSALGLILTPPICYERLIWQKLAIGLQIY